MLKLVFIAAIITIACRMLTGRWPWQLASTQSTRKQALSRARTLLGVNENASRDEVLRAHKTLISLVHPDRGGTTEQVHEANAARDLLIQSKPKFSSEEPL